MSGLPVSIELLISEANLRECAEEMHNDMAADHAAGSPEPPLPIEQIERELLEGWAQEIEEYIGTYLGRGLVEKVTASPPMLPSDSNWSTRHDN